jgi:hypothetical protein
MIEIRLPLVEPIPTIKQKQELSKEIDDLVKQFLDKGGKIQVIEQGKSAIKDEDIRLTKTIARSVNAAKLKKGII